MTLLEKTRSFRDKIVTSGDLVAYGKNWADNNYGLNALQRGVEVFTVRGKSYRHFMFHVFRRDEERFLTAFDVKKKGPQILHQLLNVQQLTAHYVSPTTEFDSVQFAYEMFRRPVVHWEQRPSLACSILGLPEVEGRPSRKTIQPHVDALLRVLAALDRIDPSILRCPDDPNPARGDEAGGGKKTRGKRTVGKATAGEAVAAGGKVAVAAVAAAAAVRGEGATRGSVGQDNDNNDAATGGGTAAAVGGGRGRGGGSTGVVFPVASVASHPIGTAAAAAGSNGQAQAVTGDVRKDEVRELALRINGMSTLDQAVLFTDLREQLSVGALEQLRLQVDVPSMKERSGEEQLQQLARGEIRRLKAMQRD